MNAKHTQIHHRSRVFLLTTLLITLVFLLAACGTMPHREGLALRASVGAGATHAKGEIDNPITGETESESATGGTYGVRAELSSQPEGFDNMAVGLRLQASMRDVSEDGLGQDGDGEIDLEMVGGELHGVVRRYFPVTDSVRPYGELFGGFSYNEGELTVSGGGLLSPLVADGHDWGGVGGLGVGLELDLSSSASMFVQGDWSIRFSDVDPFRFQIQDVMLWVGGEVRW